MRKIRDDAANARADQQHGNSTTRSRPIRGCGLCERATEPGIDQIGEVPGEPERDSQVSSEIDSRMNPRM